MPYPPVTIAQLEALLAAEGDDLCERIVKLGETDAAWAAIYKSMFNEDLTVTTEFQTEICGVCNPTTTTTSTTSTSTTTTTTSTTTTTTSTSTTTSTTTTTTTSAWQPGTSASGTWIDLATSTDGVIALGANLNYGGYCQRTTNKGLTWSNVLPSKATGCDMAADGAKMYVGTTSLIWRSADTGATWASIAEYSIAISCNSTGSEVLSAGSTAIRRSTDSGATFADVFVYPLSGWVRLNCLCISGDDSCAYVVIGNSNGSHQVYKSTDAGRAVWTLVAGNTDISPSGDMMCIACSADGAIVILGTTANIWYSTDGGANFAALNYYSEDVSISNDGTGILLVGLFSSLNSFRSQTGIGGLTAESAGNGATMWSCAISRDELVKYVGSMSGLIYVRIT